MNKFFSNILMLATAVCAALYVYEHRQVAREKARSAELGTALAESSLALSNALAANADMAEKIADANDALARLQRRLAQMSTATTNVQGLQGIVDSMKQNIQAGAITNRPANPGAEFMKALGGILNTSETKDFMRNQTRTQIDAVYAPLLASLSLSEQDAEWLKDLIAERQVATTSALLANMGLQTDEEKKAAAAELARSQTGYDDKIREMLGEPGFAQYQEYQKTEEERMTVSRFKEQLAPENALDSKQEQNLITAMYEERKAVRGDDETGRFGLKEGESMGQAFSRTMNQQREIHTRTAERAKTILTPKQFESFQASQGPRWGRGGRMGQPVQVPATP